MTEPTEIFIAYESWHIGEAHSQATRGAKVVCLDFWVERELKKNNIPYISLRDVIDAETGAEEWWLLAQDVAREWYRIPAMKFFEYDGIRIGEVLEPIMETYLSRLFYYVRICNALKRAYPGAHFSIPSLIVKETPATKCLVSFELRAVVDAARMSGLWSTVLGKPIEPRSRSFLRTIWKSLLLRVYNTLIVFVPHRSLKIYASEYWSHIGPIIEQMDDVELVLTESGELKHIPWRQLIKHRVRVRNPAGVIHSAEKRSAIKASGKFLEEWRGAKKEVIAYFNRSREELDWSPVLEACEYLMTYASRIIADINALQCIMKEENPNVVLLLASVGLREHPFFLIARIATQLNIPSVELQHAASSTDQRSVYSRIETEYLASYGAYTNSSFERIGYAHDRLVSIGSPRFDRCFNERADALGKGKQLLKELGLDTKRPILVAAVPPSNPTLFVFEFDSYQLAGFFEAVRAAQRAVPSLQVLFKFRNYNHVGATREYLKELFPVDSAIAGNEDLFALLCAGDAAMCGFSTFLYEVLLAQKPLILFPWKELDTYNAQMYALAAPIVRTTKEVVDILARIFTDSSYRQELLSRQGRCLKEYSFDGNSSKRVATFLRRLSQ